MKCKHFALLLVASSFLLTSVPAQAELEDAPLPGDFQAAPPARQPKPVAPAPLPARVEKPQASAAPASDRPAAAARAEPSRKKQLASRSKASRKAAISLKSRRTASKTKQHMFVARKGVTSVKAGKKSYLAVRKHGQTKRLKKAAATPSKKVASAKKVTSTKKATSVKKAASARKVTSTKKARQISKKPLKTIKKKASSRQSNK